MRNGHALVLFSGGQDSTTCLAWALQHFAHVRPLALTTASATMSSCGHAGSAGRAARLLVFRHGTKRAWVGSRQSTWPLLEPNQRRAHARHRHRGWTLQACPSTCFVPGRSLLFFPAGRRRGLPARTACTLVGGMCRDRLLRLPDCRDDTLKALQVASIAGYRPTFAIETPLMWLDKAPDLGNSRARWAARRWWTSSPSRLHLLPGRA